MFWESVCESAYAGGERRVQCAADCTAGTVLVQYRSCVCGYGHSDAGQQPLFYEPRTRTRCTGNTQTSALPRRLHPCHPVYGLQGMLLMMVDPTATHKGMANGRPTHPMPRPAGCGAAFLCHGGLQHKNRMWAA